MQLEKKAATSAVLQKIPLPTHPISEGFTRNCNKTSTFQRNLYAKQNKTKTTQRTNDTTMEMNYTYRHIGMHRKQPRLTLVSTQSQAGLIQPGCKLFLLGRLCSQWLHPVLGEDCMYLAGTVLGDLLPQDRNTQQDTSNTIHFLKRKKVFRVPKGARLADKTESYKMWCLYHHLQQESIMEVYS